MICEKTTVIKPVSRCMYCNSTSYGKGCRFAPGGVHFHGSDAKKCSYCGSPNYGKGCRLNPVEDTHVHGIQYNSMFTESIQSSIRKELLLRELTKPITEHKAYELGIIDCYGNKIKEPVTEEEMQSYLPLNRTILRIKRHLGSKLDVIAGTALFEDVLNIDYNKEHHKKILSYESKIRNKIDEIFEIIDNAISDGITFSELDELLQK